VVPDPAGRFPVRLPPGWAEGEAVDGWRTAYPPSGRPRPTILHRTVSTCDTDVAILLDGLCAELPARYPGLLVLDRSAGRLLTAHSGLTTAYRLVAGPGIVHIAAAVMPTHRYAELGPLLERTLGRLRVPA